MYLDQEKHFIPKSWVLFGTSDAILSLFPCFPLCSFLTQNPSEIKH